MDAGDRARRRVCRWMLLVGLWFLVFPVLASEIRSDPADTHEVLATLASEDRLTGRALRAFGGHAALIDPLAMALREAGHDLLAAGPKRVAQWHAAADAGDPQLLPWVDALARLHQLLGSYQGDDHERGLEG